MNSFWILWLVCIVLSFAWFEYYAFQHPDRQNTLSRFIWSVGQKWPFSLVLFGALFGGLAVHFYWNWCPALMLPGHGG